MDSQEQHYAKRVAEALERIATVLEQSANYAKPLESTLVMRDSPPPRRWPVFKSGRKT